MSKHKARVIELLKAVGRNSSRTQIFTDFLILIATAISNKMETDKTIYAEREKCFLTTANRYSREDVAIFFEGFAELILALEDSIGQKCLRINAPTLEEAGFYMQFPLKGTKPKFSDVLGEIFSEMELNEQGAGQVFTPSFAADLMANLAMPEDVIRAAVQRDGFVVFEEPCCGSGAIVLEGLNRLLKFKINPQRRSLVIANDIDTRCVLMSYIQLSLYGIPAIVQQKNAATDEEISAPWYTPMFRYDDWARKYQQAEPIKKEPPPKQEEPAGQLTLF